MHFLINFIGFQAAWFACALGVPSNHPEWIVLICSIFLGYHFYICQNSFKELELVVKVCALGLIVDSVLNVFNFVSFGLSYPEPFMHIQPWWMLLLWACFASTLNISFKWLKNKYKLASILGAISAPLSYLGGEKFNALALHGTQSWIAIAVVWAIAMPIMVSWISVNKEATR